MKRHTIEIRFEPGERVYYMLPDSPAGIVLDWRYASDVGQIQYCVSFSHETESLWYYEFELSETPIFK
jgi:hypothetical protein